MEDFTDNENSTLIGENFASLKLRETFWINFRELEKPQNFAK